LDEIQLFKLTSLPLWVHRYSQTHL
jgi:hypothetical protein